MNTQSLKCASVWSEARNMPPGPSWRTASIANSSSLIPIPPERTSNTRRISRSSTNFSYEAVRPPSSQPAACITRSQPPIIVAHSVFVVSTADWTSSAFDEHSPPPPR